MFLKAKGEKLILGLVHLVPMPSTPLYAEGNIEKMTRKAISDCMALKNGGADGGLVQSVDGIYPSTDDTDYARVATISAVAARVRDAVGPDFVLGVQLMWNCITPSLAACKAAGADFTRCSVLVGSADSPYGRISADPMKILNYRKMIGANDIAMISEISGYHNNGDYNKQDIQNRASTSMKFGADAIEVVSRDFEMNERLVKDIKELGNVPVILGGGTDVSNCKARLRYADGALVGTAFEGGNWGGPIQQDIVAAYMKNIHELEEELPK